MAAKMFLIAAFVLAVAANATRQVHDQDDDYRPETDYKPNKNEYTAETDYKIKSVKCLGVDVTNDCIHRADGNYAIDNEPRSGYVACVRHRAICMPCPYGLVFCAKAGYNGLGQCLGRYDECPPRRY